MPASMTLEAAVGPDSYAIRRMIREHGEEIATAWIIAAVTEADILCGGKNDGATLAMFGRMALQQFAHRSVESLCMAIRDGLKGKVYGQLTYPQLAEWMNDHEARILAMAESEAARHRYTGDNLGAAYLDGLEKKGERAMQGEIDRLRAKLKNKD